MEDRSIVKKTPTFTSSVLLDIASEIKEDEIIKKINCKFCNSPYRGEAEELYEQVGSISPVFKFLRGKGEELSYPAVRSHLCVHYVDQYRKIGMKAYAQDVEKILVQKRDKRSQCMEMIAMLDKERYELASISQGASPEEKRRNSEAIRKLADSSLAWQKEIDVMDEALKPLELIMRNFQIILSEELKNSKSEETKKALMNVCDRLIKTVEDVHVQID